MTVSVKTKLNVWEGLIQASHLKNFQVRCGWNNHIKIWKDFALIWKDKAGLDKNKFSVCGRKQQGMIQVVTGRRKGQRTQESNFIYTFFSLLGKNVLGVNVWDPPGASMLLWWCSWSTRGRIKVTLCSRLLKGSWDREGHRPFSVLFFSGVTFSRC